MWIPCQRHILSVSCHVKIAGTGAYLHILQKPRDGRCFCICHITSIFLKIKAKTSTGMSLMDMVELVPTMRKSKVYLRINKNSYK